MHAVTTGALRHHAWAPTAAHFFTTGFQHPDNPVLTGRFVVINLRDVTEGPYFGYDWRLTAHLVVPTAPWGPYEPRCDGTVEGAHVLATWTSPLLRTFTSAQQQADHLLAWATAQSPRLDTPAATRARHQMALAEYYWHKAQDARQGVADRLWRDRLLDDADPGTRADLTEWIDQFGQRPMTLRAEDRAHETALWYRDPDRPD